mgnify:FL=1
MLFRSGLFIRKSVKKNKLRRVIFITVTLLIAIGLVIPMAGLFQKQPGNSGATGDDYSQQTLQEKLSNLEDKARANPGDKVVLMDLAETYIYSGQPEQAVKTYEQVLGLDPGNTEARINIATIYYYSSQYDPAIAQLQDLIQRDPDNKSAHYLYSIILGTGKKDYASAIREMETFIALAKEGPDVEKARQAIDEWKKASAQ